MTLNDKPKLPTADELMALNRRERRRLGKLNGITIPGSNVPKSK